MCGASYPETLASVTDAPTLQTGEQRPGGLTGLEYRESVAEPESVSGLQVLGPLASSCTARYQRLLLSASVT